MMILPTKRLREDRALLTIAAEILSHLDEPATVSRLWEEVRSDRATRHNSSLVTYDWFILALDLVYIMGIVKLERGLIVRNQA